MKWYAISGSWRSTDESVEEDVEDTVKNIVSKGNGIVTGGALGVDYMATKKLLEIASPKDRLKIYLPLDLESYKKHFLKRADEGVITLEQAKKIISQLEQVHRKCPGCIFDRTRFTEVNKESYHSRNTSIIENCDELYAFQVNESKGTQDAIDKAKKLGKPVYVKKYSIQT